MVAVETAPAGVRCRRFRMADLKLLPLFLLLSLGLLLTPLMAVPAAAQQDGADPKLLINRVTAGGYDLAVAGEASNLSLGSAQFSVTVREAATGQSITDARVQIRTRHLLHDETGWATALSVPARPEEYRARMKLEYPGPWQVSVEVDGPLGRAGTDVGSVTVPEPRQYVVGTLVFAGVSVVLLMITGYLVWSIRRSQRRREAANAG